MASESRELQALIAERDETPILVGSELVDHDACELYRFADGTEVIVTNAGLIAEDEDGFSDLKGRVLAN